MRELRRQLRCSQSELKDRLNDGLARSYDKPKISRWENGHEPVPEDVARELKHLVSGRPRDARTLVLANQKGGVGKTTSALNLAYALSLGGRRVLLVDMDPQATATVGLLAGDSVEAYRQGAHDDLGDPGVAADRADHHHRGRSRHPGPGAAVRPGGPVISICRRPTGVGSPASTRCCARRWRGHGPRMISS